MAAAVDGAIGPPQQQTRVSAPSLPLPLCPASIAPTRAPSQPPANRSSQPSRSVGVFGLNPSVTSDDLRDVFEPFGKIRNIQIVNNRNGKSPFSFVEFDNLDDAIDAKEKIHETRILGETVRTVARRPALRAPPLAHWQHGLRTDARHGGGMAPDRCWRGARARATNRGGAQPLHDPAQPAASLCNTVRTCNVPQQKLRSAARLTALSKATHHRFEKQETCPRRENAQ